jgi:hypothetical protein
MRSIREAINRQAGVIPGGPASGVNIKEELFKLFPPSPPNSVNALRIAMGPFKPKSDAFHFPNTFPLTAENANQLQQHYQTFSDAVIGTLVETVTGSLSGINVLGVGLPNPIISVVVGKVTEFLTDGLASKAINAIIGAIPGTFGRCGGMAFSGYDFYLAGWPVDERLGTTPPATGDLGDYIFQRLLDSLDQNAGTFLVWLMNYYVMPDAGPIATTALGGAVGLATGPEGAAIGAAIGALIGSQADIFHWGGPGVLLSNTKTQWPLIKAKLDAQAAYPIGIVFGDTIVPTEQHQILAVGYSDPGDGTATLDVWDNNDANLPRSLTLDFRGSELQVSNFLNNRPVKGIFLEGYSPAVPPASLHLPFEASEAA